MTTTMNTILTELLKVRHYMHKHPELSGLEEATAAYVADYLRDNCYADEVYTGIGGHGLVAIFDSKKPGKNVLFRAELDALPITETNSFGHISCCAGVSHKCGHDGHAATLLGLGLFLSHHRPEQGRVLLLFQPAEETGCGAEAMLQDPKFGSVMQTYSLPNFVFAFHNVPGYPLGTVMIREGSFTASVKSLVITFKGKTSHAAEPEHGINPSLAIAQLLIGLAALSNNDVKREDFRVITPVHVSLGEPGAYGVSAGRGEVHLTVRTWTEAEMSHLEADIIALVEAQCTRDTVGMGGGLLCMPCDDSWSSGGSGSSGDRNSATTTGTAGLTYEMRWTEVFRANESADEAVATVRRAAAWAATPAAPAAVAAALLTTDPDPLLPPSNSNANASPNTNSNANANPNPNSNANAIPNPNPNGSASNADGSNAIEYPSQSQCQGHVDRISVTELPYPMKWGEDFGLFSQRFRGCFFGLGAGDWKGRPALHNPDYDYPDALLEVGLKVFVGILVDLGVYSSLALASASASATTATTAAITMATATTSAVHNNGRSSE